MKTRSRGRPESERRIRQDWADGRFRYNSAPQAYPHWHGTLLTEKRDAPGLLYRLNRYYDPASGRFTQEDPIGLAGGVNVYGFAVGDPVNFSDPYGLCPPQFTGKPCSGWVSVFAPRIARRSVPVPLVRSNRIPAGPPASGAGGTRPDSHPPAAGFCRSPPSTPHPRNSPPVTKPLTPA